MAAHLGNAHPRAVTVEEHVRVHHVVALRLSSVRPSLHVVRVLRAAGVLASRRQASQGSSKKLTGALRLSG